MKVIAKLGCAFSLALMFASPWDCVAQKMEPASTVSALKQLSLDELLDLHVTSASKRPEKLMDVASAIQLVTGDDIRRSEASSIPEALRLVGNLQVAQKGSHSWAISARGFNTDSANKLLVLFDGRAVYTPLFSGVFWDRQNYLLEDIDRIEVISGPGGTLWGANAVNGVINITSKSARETQGGILEVGGGSELEDFAAVRQGGKLAPDVYFRVYASYSNHDDAVLANGTGAGDAWHSAQGGFRIDASRSGRDTFTFQGDVYRLNESLATGGRSRVDGGNLLGRWSRKFSPDSDMSLQVYFDRTQLTLPVPPVIFAPAGTLGDDLETYDIDFQHRLKIGATNNVVWGAGFRRTRDVVSNAPGLAFFPRKLDQNLFSAFFQDEISLSDTVAVSVGTKVEHNDYTGGEMEPGIRLRWSVTPRQMLWAAVSRAVRAPSRIERDFSQPAPGYTIVILTGNPDFDSETVTAWEAGYRAQVGDDATVSVSAFLNDYDHLRSTSMSPPDPVFNLPFPFFFENNLEGTTYGLEVDATCQVRDWWRLRGSASLLREDIGVKPGHTDFNNALNETSDPEQQFSLRSSMDLPGGLTFDTALRWVGSLATNNIGVVAEVPRYTELDARIGWTSPGGIELSIVGRNLLHGQHLEYRAANAPLVGIERSVFGKVTWRF